MGAYIVGFPESSQPQEQHHNHDQALHGYCARGGRCELCMGSARSPDSQCSATGGPAWACWAQSTGSVMCGRRASLSRRPPGMLGWGDEVLVGDVRLW